MWILIDDLLRTLFSLCYLLWSCVWFLRCEWRWTGVLCWCFGEVAVLVRVSITVVKHNDQKQCGEEMVFCLPTLRSYSITEGIQGKNLEVETEAEAMEKCFLLACSSWFAQLCFLKPFRTLCPGMVPPAIGWTLPHQLLIKKMHHKFAYRPVCWGHFLSWGFLFSSNSSLCRVDRKLTMKIARTVVGLFFLCFHHHDYHFYFTSLLQFSLPPLIIVLFHHPTSTHSSIFLQKMSGLSYISTKYGISIPNFSKAGWNNPICGKGSQKPAKELETSPPPTRRPSYTTAIYM